MRAAHETLFGATLICFVGGLGFACGSEPGDPSPDAGGAAEDAGTDGGRDARFGRLDSGPRPDVPLPGPRVVVWAHSSNVLFTFNPETFALVEIGRWEDADTGEFLSSMYDLAVSGDEEVFTVDSSGNVYQQRDGSKFVRRFRAEGASGLNGLSFLPRGTLDVEDEVLVGTSSSGQIIRIDIEGETSEMIGTLGDFRSSGDIVGIEGEGIFVAAQSRTGGGFDGDVLIELDPETLTPTAIGDGIGFGGVYGLGYWRGVLYGFTNRGQLISIDPESGEGELVEEGVTGSFWGAGVTTVAPMIPF